jgi:diadenosine tetraphosphatase ApaH/serine/threonine PP2A family protein phosphatase
MVVDLLIQRLAVIVISHCHVKAQRPFPDRRYILVSQSRNKDRTVIALLADIHSNLQALEACLEDARGMGASRFVFLGDCVGYGGDPDAVLTLIQHICAKGGIGVKGNHDDMACDFDRQMNPSAARAAKWTREQLSQSQREFLDQLPMVIHEDDRLYVHADASDPMKWRYVTDIECARDSLEATQARVVICGHVHQPAIYGRANDGNIVQFVPDHDCPVPLLKSRRWHIVLPSVGQPRDNNPLAGYGLLDPLTNEIKFRRIPYDVESAAARIREVGLPSGLADRLHKGR